MSRLCFDYGHGVIVHEIRTADTNSSLQQRSNYENKNNYDFIEMHLNLKL